MSGASHERTIPGPDESTEDLARLSRIETQWSLVIDAHAQDGNQARMVREVLLKHYAGAVFRYLMGAVRDREAAEELTNEFAVRLLQGKLHRASPDRGRFRDYLKTVLINLVNDYFRSRRDQPSQLSVDRAGLAVNPDTPDLDELSTLEDCLHDQFLDVAWLRLSETNARYYAVLKARVADPDATARQLAEIVSTQLDCEMKSASFRKTLERARLKFASLLVDVVREASEPDSPDELRRELKSLGLLGYCEPVLTE